MLLFSIRKKADGGLVWLFDRCCEKRASTPGCQHPLLLRHLHPSGHLLYLLISPETNFLFTGWGCPSKCSIKGWIRWHISNHTCLCLQIGFLLSVPRLPTMVEKEDFELEGLEFMVGLLTWSQPCFGIGSTLTCNPNENNCFRRKYLWRDS